MLPSVDPFGQRGRFLESVSLADRLGLDSVWVGDHLQFHPPVLEAVCALAAAAGRSDRLRLGSSVMLLALRQPAWLAKQIAALMELAPGRLLLGVGAGGENPAEFDAAGVSHARRGRRLDEILELLPQLLAGKPVEHHSAALELSSPSLLPAPGTTPPVLVGGRSAAARRRAARFGDAWLPMWMTPGRVAEGRAEIEAGAAAAGRAAPRTEMAVFFHVDPSGPPGEELREFFRRQYGMDYEKVERYTLAGPIDHVAERLAELRAAGVGGFIMLPAARDPLAQFEHVAELRSRQI